MVYIWALYSSLARRHIYQNKYPRYHPQHKDNRNDSDITRRIPHPVFHKQASIKQSITPNYRIEELVSTLCVYHFAHTLAAILNRAYPNACMESSPIQAVKSSQHQAVLQSPIKHSSHLNPKHRFHLEFSFSFQLSPTPPPPSHFTNSTGQCSLLSLHPQASHPPS
jgi:hypothetical protein